MSTAVIAGIVAAVVVLLLAGSIAALVLQRRRARKAKRADDAHTLVILPKTPEQARAGVRVNTLQDRLDRINYGDRGANTLPHNWICIRHDADERLWYYLDMDTSFVWRSPAGQQYAPVEFFTRVSGA